MSGVTPDPTLTAGRMAPHGATGVQCTARAKATGDQCRRAAIRGGKVCYVHGGNAPQVRAAAQRRRELAEVEAEARNAIAFDGQGRRISDPLMVLAELASEALAMKEALAARVNSLPELRYTAGGAGTEQLRAEVAAYERAMDRSARFLEVLAKSGFEERRTQLAEGQGALVVQLLRRIFDRLDLSEQQRGLLPSVVPEELRRLTVAGEVVR